MNIKERLRVAVERHAEYACQLRDKAPTTRLNGDVLEQAGYLEAWVGVMRQRLAGQQAPLPPAPRWTVRQFGVWTALYEESGIWRAAILDKGGFPRRGNDAAYQAPDGVYSLVVAVVREVNDAHNREQSAAAVAALQELVSYLEA